MRPHSLGLLAIARTERTKCKTYQSQGSQIHTEKLKRQVEVIPPGWNRGAATPAGQYLGIHAQDEVNLLTVPWGRITTGKIVVKTLLQLWH